VGDLLYVTQCAAYLDGPAGAHGVLPQTTFAMAELAGSAELGFLHVPDVRDLDDAALESARAVALFTIGETPWSESQKATLLRRVRAGDLAVVAVHAATDSCYGWDDYRLLVGARFDGHPWTQEVALEVVDRDHAATAHLPDGWRMTDEVYVFRDLRPDARVLLRVPPDQLDGGSQRMPPFGFPLSWCFTEGRGRVFSTTLGHFPTAWENPVYLRHLAGGLAWALASRTP
jgi:type 1 glutamine amidotransferase